MPKVVEKRMNGICNDVSNDSQMKLPGSNGDSGLANQNVVKVESSATLFVEPDVIEFYIRVDSIKDSAEEVKKSISKRVDYLLQVVKAKIKGDKNISVHELLDKRDDIYSMTAEVLVKCDTLQKYEEIRNVAIEKLEGTVYVSDPRFYHTHRCLQDARMRVLRQAMSCARSKAMELASLSQQPPGHALLVQELESSERAPPQLEDNFNAAMSQRTHASSRILTSRLQVVYELTKLKHEKPSQLLN